MSQATKDYKSVCNIESYRYVDHAALEKYLCLSRPIQSRLPFHYHLVPGSLRVALIRLLLRLKRQTLNRACVSDFFKRGLANSVHRVTWPEGKSYCVLFTHDVDTQGGFNNICKFSQLESRYGIYSSWHILFRHYRLDSARLSELKDQGHEIASHGYNHDTKLSFLEDSQIRKRLEFCRKRSRGYGCWGFRSPALAINHKLLNMLSEYFIYDTSIPDVELSGGCGSLFPFFIGNLLEIPLTVPMDATLISLGFSPREILGIWREKINFIKSMGAVAVVTTHIDTHFSGNRMMMETYESLISKLSADKDAWIIRPIDLVNFWKGSSYV